MGRRIIEYTSSTTLTQWSGRIYVCSLTFENIAMSESNYCYVDKSERSGMNAFIHIKRQRLSGDSVSG